MSYIGRQLNNLSDRVKLDSITTSATATYNLLLNTVAYVPSSAESLTVSLNGVIQAPQDSYTVSGSTITFASTLSASDSIDFILAERSITLQTPSSGSVNTEQLADSSVTLAKLSATGTKDATTFLRGDNTFASAGVDGISSSSSSTAINIATNGEVTKPLNPAFRVYQSTGTNYANGHTMYNQNITEVYDVNADMGTNGSFTAPVTGKYLFTVSIYDTSAADGREYDMILTTSNRNYRWGQRQEYEADVTGFGGNMKLEGTIIVDMDANDTAYVTSGVNATFTNGANSEHSYFSGILIG